MAPRPPVTGDAQPLSGVVVAARPVPADSPALRATAASFGAVPSRGAQPVEIVLALDTGGAITVMQPAAAHLAPGTRATVVPGPPIRVTPAP